MSEPNSERTYTFDNERLQTFVSEILRSGGVADEHADRIADGLTRADMRGVNSHGIARLEVYMDKFDNGGFNQNPNITTTHLRDAVALVDADNGPGQSAAFRAMNEAIDIARTRGVGMVAVTNSNHFGTAAYYTEHAADQGLIGLSMTNVGPDVIPFGGAKPFLGTNPISFSIPTNRSFSVTLDMATSVVAMGKIQEEARRNDTTIPEEWAVDENGHPTTDPHDAVAVRPLGGPKGYGLGIVVDVFCGLLSGAGPSQTVGPLYDNFEQPMELGHFVGAIDIQAFRDLEVFKEEMGHYIDQLKAVETRDGFDEVMLPGEIETAKYQQQKEDGITLQCSTVNSLQNLADRYNVPFPGSV